MLIFARVHSMELEMFAVSFLLMSRHQKYNVQFLEALLHLFINFICLTNNAFPKKEFPLNNKLSFFQCSYMDP